MSLHLICRISQRWNIKVFERLFYCNVFALSSSSLCALAVNSVRVLCRCFGWGCGGDWGNSSSGSCCPCKWRDQCYINGQRGGNCHSRRSIQVGTSAACKSNGGRPTTVCLTSLNRTFYQLSLLLWLPCNFVVIWHRIPAVYHWAKTESSIMMSFVYNVWTNRIIKSESWTPIIANIQGKWGLTKWLAEICW